MSNEQKKPIPPLQTITTSTLVNTDYPPTIKRTFRAYTRRNKEHREAVSCISLLGITDGLIEQIKAFISAIQRR